MVRLPQNESKHIDWTLGLKCDHWVWPWTWPWPRFFKVKYRICYISAKNGRIATKQKANISIEPYGSNETIGFDLDHDLDLNFSRWNIEFAISQPKMVRLPRNEKQTYRLNSRAQMWPSGLTLTFKVKYTICYISAKNGPIATKQKANIWSELKGSNLPDSDRGDFSCRGAIDSSSFLRSSIKFEGHTGQKIADFYPNWAFPDYNSSLNSLRG